jgi:hypothetical protein
MHVSGGGFLEVIQLLAGERRATAAARTTASTKVESFRVDADRISKARALWARRQPLDERYLRARGLRGPFPETLGLLPARGKQAPAMIAPFGIPIESEPGRIVISPEAVMAAHMTRLLPDGSGKATEGPAKITLGCPKGSPIILAPPNDGLGLVITEGIEDALSAHEATGLGAWAAGSAGLMPALAAVVPAYIDCVTVLAHDDLDGARHAGELTARLRKRRTGCVLAFLGKGGPQRDG